MRRGWGAAGMFGLAVAIWAAAAAAADYESGFGFGISVPEVWLVLTRDEVAENASVLLEDAGEERALDGIPPAMRRAVFDRIRAGELEIFYRREGLAGAFVDNVNIMIQPASLPRDDEQLEGICRVLPAEFSRVFGRPIAMDRCELRERASRRALYLQFDGAIPGTTTLQYQVQRGLGETLVLTATAAKPNLARMMDEFEEMVSSIRIR